MRIICRGLPVSIRGLLIVISIFLLMDHEFQSRLALILDNRSLAQMIEMIHSKVEPIRYEISNEIRARVPHMIAQALLPALTVGIRDYLHTDHWVIFSATGTSHLVAISGLHVGMVWAIFFSAFRSISGSPLASWPKGIAAISALVYSLLAGFSLPTQRAILMLVVVLLLSMSKRVVRPFDAWTVALIVTVIADPTVVASLSFWLSYSAVGLLIGLALVAKGQISKLSQKCCLWMRAQLVLTFGLAPLLVGHFGMVSWISPLMNMIAVPVVTLIIIPCMLLVGFVEGCVIRPIQILHSYTNGFYIDYVLIKLSKFFCSVVDVILIFLSNLLDMAWRSMSALVENHNVMMYISAAQGSHEMWSFYLCCWLIVLLLILPRYFPCKGMLAVGGMPLFFTLFGLNFNN